MILRVIIIFFTIASFLNEAQAQGSWSLTIDHRDLQGGPGSALIDVYESRDNEVSITTDKNIGDWTVWVKRIDITWTSDFRLSARRTGPGKGKGTVGGGTAYQEVTMTDEYFFDGNLQGKNIPVQLKLNLLADVVDSKIYETTVVFTVTEP